MNETERRFRERVAELGGRVTETKWLGGRNRNKIVCAEGHEAAPRPTDVNRGGGICRTCSGCDPAAAEQAFRNRVTESGGRVVEPRWLGGKKRHRIICGNGHEVTAVPGHLQRGVAVCLVCSGREPGRPERMFRARVAEAGGRIEEPTWLGVNAPHLIICKEGHRATPRPADVNVGGGTCRECGHTSPVRAEREFRALVARAGGRVLEPVWLGVKVRHRVVCKVGHEVMPRPNDAQQTGSICRICAGFDSATSEREFRERVIELGGRVIEPTWLGNKAAHRVICKAGHEVTTRPNNVQQGSGFCRICAYKVWDVFYVVTSGTLNRVKVGITSNGGKSRLRLHRGAGYETVVKTIVGLEDAPDLERAVLATLKLGGVAPVHGREYYDISALPVILDVVNHW